MAVIKYFICDCKRWKMSWGQVFTAYPGVWHVNSYREGFYPNKDIIRGKKADYGIGVKNSPDEYVKNERWKRIKRAKLSGSSEKKTGDSKKIVVCSDYSSSFFGNLYNTDTKIAVYGKLMGLVFFRPFQYTVKFFYHASLLAVAYEIFEGIRKKTGIAVVFQRSICACVDIVRTPIYGVAITAITIAGVLGAPFHSDFIYDVRAVNDRLIRELHWGRPKKDIYEFPCMLSSRNIMDQKVVNKAI